MQDKAQQAEGILDIKNGQIPAGRPVVCVQGLGFVGTAMATAIAAARDRVTQVPYFDVIGVELPTPEGLAKLDAINAGILPFECADTKLMDALSQAHTTGNLMVTTDSAAYALANVTVVDVNLDVAYGNGEPTLALHGFRAAIRMLGQYMQPGALIIVETTVPPGTCEKVAAPELAAALAERNLPPDALLLAHAYERVMPGKDYLDSITNFWRVYAGHTPKAADACEEFLSKLINIEEYPLTRLPSTTASEIAKVLENSYRATTIAFMEEWSRFAEAVGVDLFEVVSAIRRRPTHNNMRQPGFGVGGYCLTKDPLLTGLAAKEFYDVDLKFPFSSQAVSTNNAMPLVTLDYVQQLLGGDLSGKTILLLGVSYRQDVGDTRYSPAQPFVIEARARGAKIMCHDPLLDYWPELDWHLLDEIPDSDGLDAVVFSVPHKEYVELDLPTWLNGASPLIVDANNVLGDAQRYSLTQTNCRLFSIGRGLEKFGV